MPCTGEPLLNAVDYEAGEEEEDLYDEENESLLNDIQTKSPGEQEEIDNFDNIHIKHAHNNIQESDIEIDFANILRDVPEVEEGPVNQSLSPRLVSVNVTSNSLTWVVGKQDPTIAADKYQV